MSQVAINDLIDQYQRAFRMLYEEIERFDEREWVEGLDYFLVPVKLAMHTVDCLDYYFCGRPADQYTWGHRFGGGWWELPAERWPTKEMVLAYAREVEARVLSELSDREDHDLASPFTIDDAAATWLGHYVYALRHTMHHHGQLAALNVHHGNEGGCWA